MPPTTLHARFAALTEVLRAHRAVWGPRPFEGPPMAWEAEHSDVAAFVDGLPVEAFDAFDAAWVTPDAPATLRAWTGAAAAHADLPRLSIERPRPLPNAAQRGLPGRKVNQIEHFLSVVEEAGFGHQGIVIDWCAGKGHLGRNLCARHGTRLLAIEWDPALCADGRLRSAREDVEAEFACLDARGPEAAARLGPGQTVIALHACGDLHSALLRAAAARGVEAVALAPCCYNKAGAERGHALSAAGAAANLGLTPADLDLVHREQVVARGRDRRRAWQSMAWRLGFDLLQRDVRAVDRYRPMRAFPNAWLTLPFAEFCRRFAAVDDLDLPADLDPTPYEARGWQRLAQVRPRDAVRGLFRPALEAWLVLDRALYLAERGFDVQVGRFCPRTLTPRNAVVIGRRVG